MPPRGVKKGTKRARQYEHVKDSAKRRGASTGRAKEMAARTVNKERAKSGETRGSSSSRSRSGGGSSRSGASGSSRSGGRTKEQLYAEAKRKGVEGRSKMNKAQLEKAVGR